MEYEQTVQQLLISRGIPEKEIGNILTSDIIAFALNNNLSAEDLVWGLLF